MDVVTVVNLALTEIGQRTTISSISPPDGSTAAQTAALIYTPKIQALLRSALWGFARKQAPLSLYKSLVVGNQISSNPPPQGFLYEYLWPSDCLRMRFIIPTAQMAPPGTPLTTAPNAIPPLYTPPTRIPFVDGSDTDPQGNPLRVILSNLPLAQAVYTFDASQLPALWDSLFLTAATSLLGAYFSNSLSRDRAQMDQQVGIARGAVEAARMQNASEGTPTADLRVDWMTVRQSSGTWWGWGLNNTNGIPWGAGFDQLEVPGGMRF